MDIEQQIELDIYSNTIRLWVEEAQSRTNPAAAKNLMAHYCHCIERGVQPPAALLKYVATSFALTLQGQSFEQASGLKVKRGGTSNRERDVELYAEYYLLKLDDYTYEDALNELAQRYSSPEDPDGELARTKIKKALEPMIMQHKQLKGIIKR